MDTFSPLAAHPCSDAELRLVVRRFGDLVASWKLEDHEVDLLLHAPAGHWRGVQKEEAGYLPSHASERRMRHCLQIADALARLAAGAEPANWFRRPNRAFEGATPFAALRAPGGLNAMRLQLEREAFAADQGQGS